MNAINLFHSESSKLLLSNGHHNLPKSLTFDLFYLFNLLTYFSSKISLCDINHPNEVASDFENRIKRKSVFLSLYIQSNLIKSSQTVLLAVSDLLCLTALSLTWLDLTHLVWLDCNWLPMRHLVGTQTSKLCIHCN